MCQLVALCRIGDVQAPWCNDVNVVEVVVLGSGTPNPDPDRAGSAVAVVDGSTWVLVDCGRAATQRALSAGLDLNLVRAVLITHHHSDHLNDLATLAITRWTAGATDALRVVAPAGPSAAFARACLDPFEDEAFHGQAPTVAGRRPSIVVDGFKAGDDLVSVLDIDDWRAWSVLVDHHPVEPAVGYRIDRDGARVAISGDTRVCDGMRRLADGAHVLVHEALLTMGVASSLLEWNASARSVGELATRARPDTLVLTHLIPAPTTASEEETFVDEVREGGFEGRIIVARDLMRIPAIS
jgi:ribonuclease Z